MKKLFHINESEKNRIRELHIKESQDKRITSILNEEELLKESQTLEILKTYVKGDVSDEFLLTKVKPQVEEKVKEICAPCFEDDEIELDEQITTADVGKKWWDESHIRGVDELLGKGTYTREAIIKFLNTEEGFKMFNTNYNPTPKSIDMLHPLDKKAGKTQSCMRCHQFFSPGGRLPNAEELMWLYQPGWDGPSWQTIELVAAGIGVVAMFFGPYGWAVSTVAGLVSAYAAHKQGDTGSAVVYGILELIPFFRLMKHLKTLSKFSKLGDTQITNSLKYLENPSPTRWKNLNQAERQVVEYTLTNKHIVSPLLKYSPEALNQTKLILNVKNLKEFNKLKNAKPEYVTMSFKEFQTMQKSIKETMTITNKIKNGIKEAAPYVVSVVPAMYGFTWAAYVANKVLFESIIDDTEDLITAKKLGNKWHYKYDRVLNQRYPYNKSFTKCEDYSQEFDGQGLLEGMPPNILLLLKVWGDKEMFPEIIPKKDSCMGVEMTEVANPGGGWRPNLCCLKDYNLVRQLGSLDTATEEIIQAIEEVGESLKNGEISEREGKEKLVDTLNVPRSYVPQIKLFADTTEYEIW